MSDFELPIEIFYKSQNAVGRGIYNRSDWAGENLLTENDWKEAQNFDQITDDNTLMDEFTDSEQSMDDSTDSEVAMDKVTDSEVAMDKVTDKEMPMDKVTNKEIAMDKVTDKEMPMDKVTDKEMPMDKVMTDVMPITKMLLSPHVIDTMWIKEMASEKFWDKFDLSPNESMTGEDGNEIKVELDKDTYNGEGYALAISQDDPSTNTNNNEKVSSINLDLTDIDTLKFAVKQVEANYDKVWLDGSMIMDDDADTSWQLFEFSVSDKSGIVELTFGQWDDEGSKQTNYDQITLEG